jgi:hypothetical protein
MNTLRFGRLGSWLALAVSGVIGAVYFLDPTRRAALTQTAGWFLTALGYVVSGGS